MIESIDNLNRQNSINTIDPLKKTITCNPLVTVAMPLLALMVSMKSTPAYTNVEELRNHVIKQMQNFEYQSKQLAYDSRTILAARYCLCTALDEAALSNSWGSHSLWSQQSLLATFHNETWGGERFFIILEKMIKENVDNNHDLLELLYFILSLGFEGKYFNDKVKHDELRSNLLHVLTMNSPPTTNQPLWIAENQEKLNYQKQRNRIPIWVTVTLSVTLLLAGAIIFEYSSNKISNPILAKINKIQAPTIAEIGNSDETIP